MIQALVWAAAGTGFTFAMTSLGAAMVFSCAANRARCCSVFSSALRLAS